jgi:hypothetical protein
MKMGYDDFVNRNHPRLTVGAEKPYKVMRNGISRDATKLTLDEENILEDFWNAWNTRFSIEAGKYAVVPERLKEQAITDCEIMKNFFSNAKFGGMFPKQGEYGARSPIAEDLIGATDYEFGATTGGTGSWSAGVYAWIHSAAQNSATLAAAATIHLQDSTSTQKWGWTWFGVESLATQSVVMNVWMKLKGSDLPPLPVQAQLRGSDGKIALWDNPIFVHPTDSFKVGVEVRTSAQDQITPYPSIIWLDGTRAIDTTPKRPSAG